MYSENGLPPDLDEVRKVISLSDVFGIGLRLFGERLFVDTRTAQDTPPFIATVAPLSSIQERMFWLGQHRPKLGMPQRSSFFFWPGSIRSLEGSGIWDAIRGRVVSAEDQRVAADADRALADLRRLEHEAIIAAITGAGHRSLWERDSSRRSQ